MSGLGDWAAQLEQARKGLEDLAELVRHYFDALRDQGFTDEQALALHQPDDED